ncbi:MAG: hypothetical protein E7067_04410 [Lentimicrobiaceae bacterium]|nr:hypothetical protein [Lentimicrobiaceae bacterium]
MPKQIVFEAMKAINEINKFASENPNSKFYIGKTDNLERRENDHQSKGYRYLMPIAETSSIDDLNELENILIKLSRLFYGENLENDRDGGGGKIADGPIYYIYLASK